MKRKIENFQYLFRLYSLVDEYLSESEDKQGDLLPEVIVGFCIVTEKILKIKLHKKNPVLVYGNAKIKEDDALIAVVKKVNLNIDTIKLKDAVYRYNLMFKNKFSDDELQVLVNMYDIRNHLVHGYKPDNEFLLDKENIVKKIGTVWEKISVQAKLLFGKKVIKPSVPKKKYSEEELEKVLIEEVKKKIDNTRNTYSPFFAPEKNFFTASVSGGDPCPRCGKFGFSVENSTASDDLFPSSLSVVPRYYFSDLYKCNTCHLELTRKEFEIAKKIKN